MKKFVWYMLHVNMNESESMKSLADIPMHTHAHPCTRGVRFWLGAAGYGVVLIGCCRLWWCFDWLLQAMVMFWLVAAGYGVGFWLVAAGYSFDWLLQAMVAWACRSRAPARLTSSVMTTKMDRAVSPTNPRSLEPTSSTSSLLISMCQVTVAVCASLNNDFTSFFGLDQLVYSSRLVYEQWGILYPDWSVASGGWGQCCHSWDLFCTWVVPEYFCFAGPHVFKGPFVFKGPHVFKGPMYLRAPYIVFKGPHVFKGPMYLRAPYIVFKGPHVFKGPMYLRAPYIVFKGPHVFKGPMYLKAPCIVFKGPHVFKDAHVFRGSDDR